MTSSLRFRILTAVALAIGGYVLFGPSDPAPAEPAKSEAGGFTHRPSAAAVAGRLTSIPSISMLAHRVVGGTSAAALFAGHSWYTPPPPPPAPPPLVLTPAQVAALHTPTAPPLPFGYIGTYTPDGSGPVFFLTEGDRVYNVRVGDSLDDKYTVDSYANGQLQLTYKPLNIQQQLTVGVSP